jgi:hypothetical protein
MSFINWGNESPEQLALRRQIEEQSLYEQAIRMAQAKQRAGQAPAGSGGDPLIGLYGIDTDGLIYQLDRSEANWSYNYDNFPDAFTRITLNTDDGFLYAVGDFEGTSYFVRINRTTRELEFINNDIFDYTVKGSSSLYYEGEGSFIYLDNFLKGTISSIVRITIDPLSPETATSTEVVEIDSDETGFVPASLFLYDGVPWAIAYLVSENSLIVGPFDIETGTFNYYNQLLPSPEEPNVESILGVFGATTHRGEVYANLVWSDGSSTDTGLFKMDTEYGGASAPYYAKFVKNMVNLGNSETVIIEIASF